ncbi:MAG: hypothetical protein ACRC92_11340 [Peptostreptococcaceae bacterium]
MIFKPLNMKHRSEESIKFMPQSLRRELVDLLDQVENGIDIPSNKIGEWLISHNKFKRDIANALIYQISNDGYKSSGFVEKVSNEIDLDPSKLINLIRSETLPVLSRLDYEALPPLYNVLIKHNDYVENNVDLINSIVEYIEERIDVFVSMDTARELDNMLLKLDIPHCKIQKDEDNGKTYKIGKSADEDMSINLARRNDYSTLIALAEDTPIYVVRGYEFSCKNTEKFIYNYISTFFRKLLDGDELLELLLKPFVTSMNKSIEEYFIDNTVSIYVPSVLREVFTRCLPFTELYIIPDNKGDDELIFKEDIARYILEEYTDSYDDYISYERLSDDFDLIHTNDNPLAEIFSIDENTDMITKADTINTILPNKTDWAIYKCETNRIEINVSYGSLCEFMSYTPFKDFSRILNMYRVFDRKTTLKEMYESYWYTEIDCTLKDYIINVNYSNGDYHASVKFDLSSESDRLELHKYMSTITNSFVDLYFKEELE